MGNQASEDDENKKKKGESEVQEWKSLWEKVKGEEME